MAEDLKAILEELRSIKEGQSVLKTGQTDIQGRLDQISKALVFVGERMLNPAHEQPVLRRILGIESPAAPSGGGGGGGYAPMPMAATGQE
jgi:hypothetical protein